MLRTLLLGLSISLCFHSCYVSDNNKQRQLIEEITPSLDDIRSVILTNSEYNKWLLKNYGYETWTPGKDDILIIENVIDHAIENDEFDFLEEPVKKYVDGYYKQYIPYINKEGDRVILLNALCELFEAPPSHEEANQEWKKIDWKNEYIAVDDGGWCYWHVTINVDKQEYEDFVVNGVG